MHAFVAIKQSPRSYLLAGLQLAGSQLAAS
jgi:hypothetical protein